MKFHYKYTMVEEIGTFFKKRKGQQCGNSAVNRIGLSHYR
ncbi:UNVERIFIED_CONTAM: hypothetical protein NCL1_14489 [Trichonephila clavipes]